MALHVCLRQLWVASSPSCHLGWGFNVQGFVAAREREEELARLIAQPFKLVGGSVPLRVYLLANDGAAGQAVLLFSAHHAIRHAA